MPQSNLLHTGYPYMRIPWNQALRQAGNFKLIQKLKKIREKQFLNTQSTLKIKFYTVIELVFYNELLIKGVYLLKPLPWHLSHLCSGGFPSVLATHRGWNKHMHLFKVWSLLWTLRFQLWFSANSFRKFGQGSKPTTCCYQDTTKPKWSKDLLIACFQLPRNRHKLRILKVLWLLYMAEELKTQLFPIISIDLWIWLYLANSTDMHYQLPTFLFLQTFIKSFFEETRSCPWKVRSYGLRLC